MVLSDEECTNMLPEFLLKERMNANKHDIESWIDYIDLQVHSCVYKKKYMFSHIMNIYSNLYPID